MISAPSTKLVYVLDLVGIHLDQQCSLAHYILHSLRAEGL